MEALFAAGGQRFCVPGLARIAVGESMILLASPLPLVSVSTGMERERQQNDSLADGQAGIELEEIRSAVAAEAEGVPLPQLVQLTREISRQYSGASDAFATPRAHPDESEPVAEEMAAAAAAAAAVEENLEDDGDLERFHSAQSTEPGDGGGGGGGPTGPASESIEPPPRGGPLGRLTDACRLVRAHRRPAPTGFCSCPAPPLAHQPPKRNAFVVTAKAAGRPEAGVAMASTKEMARR